jgi:hypothetical protein
MSKGGSLARSTETAGHVNPTLEHLEQLNDRQSKLSATETTTYVRFNLLCKQGVAGSNPVASTNLILALTIVYAAFLLAAFVHGFGTIGTTEGMFAAGSENP